jgi:hypothetical protein
MHGLLIIAAVLGTAPIENEMQTLASRPAETVISVALDEPLVKNGADKEVVRTQVELALRRCGFTIKDIKELATPVYTFASVNVISMPTSPAQGWVATVLFKVRTLVLHDGNPVFVDVTTEHSVMTGPPGSAARQMRGALDDVLDRFCNSYLEARQEAAKGREAAAAR